MFAARHVLLTWIVLLGAILAVSAAVPSKTAKNLKEDSTHIVVGKVSDIFVSVTKRAESQLIRMVAQIEIQKVEKGTGLKQGELVYARYWEKQWLGKGVAPPDENFSFFPAPKVGDQIRVYLGKNEENGLGKQKDGGYNVLLPKGFEILN